ncbi:raftlin [Eucyclogobius newberryi]|uniref:raftlin n=1 Tax=Eucyclogobius newberryi TaxID=166745 RepID=UPI003B5CBEB6
MGCGLKKMKPVSEEQSPGKIYSTLKRPQVETRVGLAYTYRYLDFLIGKDGGTSTLRLSSVREVPAQLQELYQQGFVLAALHPFLQTCGPAADSPEHQLYRAILVRNNDGVELGPSLGPQYRLQLEDCLSAAQEPTAELIQGYVKKHIQDAADQGVMFVGFIQEAYGAPCRREADTPSLSLSLHSSPSSVLGSLCSSGALDTPYKAPHSPVHEESAPCGSEEGTPRLNNNMASTKAMPDRFGNGLELLALYNLPPVREPPVRYYTVKVPLRVQSSTEGAVSSLEGPWLDHLTQHFTSGASLVHGHFHLGQHRDLQSRTLESVFIFQEPAEAEASAQAYDAIVVEQWTVIHGLQVKADYVPLLQSLASFGWRLTCVLPTPVIRTNSDGSLSTKQIVFLQRPVLSRKKRDSKKLIFKARSKSSKNCIKDSAKNKSKKSKKADKESEEAKAVDRANDGKVSTGEDTTECNTEPGTKEPGDMSTVGDEDEKEETAEVAALSKTKDVEEDGAGQVMANGLDTDPEETSTTSNEITKEGGAESQEIVPGRSAVAPPTSEEPVDI